jgi:hypothetical protein
MPSLSNAENANPTQKVVPLKEVRDGVAVLDDGSLRAILMASSINFALKSQEEQEATVAQFQNFINSLDFSVQFSIQSRNLDIDPYIEKLRNQYKREENQLLQTQISQYIEFITTFTDDADIMRKAFFVVVPYNRSVVSQDGGILDSLSGLFGTDESDDSNTSFEEARSQLNQRIGICEQGLVRTGVRVTQLETEETIELFYRLFNPGNLKKNIDSSSLE